MNILRACLLDTGTMIGYLYIATCLYEDTGEVNRHVYYQCEKSRVC